MGSELAAIGIIANPASGKDIRRLVARASVFDNQEKRAIVRRALIGMMANGARSVAYLDDAHGIVRAAIEESGAGLDAVAVQAARTASAMDTLTAARAMKALGCVPLVTLGGDGTNRAVALGWNDAVLIPISTGTNNVFPVLVEATIAGAAAGLIASGQVAVADVTSQQKLIRIRIDDEPEDIALIDAVLTAERFVGSRALLAPEQLKAALLTRADPGAVGITAIGGLLQPLDPDSDSGMLLKLGRGGRSVQAPIAPGYYQQVRVRDLRLVQPGEVITWRGPGVLAFDGERERSLRSGQRACLTIVREGPWVVDVAATMRTASEQGCFRR